MTNRPDFRDFSREERYRALEILLMWEGSCNASRLSELFQVRRENVSRQIQDYRAEYPEQMVYDTIGKTFRPTTFFTPHFCQGAIFEYLDLAKRFSSPFRAREWLECGPSPHIEPDPAIFRGLVDAISRQIPVTIAYRSWNHPEGRQRTIHPHALAYSGLRWHCRAYDEITDSFRDFHLGRIDTFSPEEATAYRYRSGRDDYDWHTTIELRLSANPSLSVEEQALVRADYGMHEGYLIVPCRRAMANYVLQSYQVPTDAPHPDNPRGRPLVCGNLREISSALF